MGLVSHSLRFLYWSVPKEVSPMFKRIWYSKWFALLLILVAGSASAYRKITRREAAQDRARQQRIAAEVGESMERLHIQLPSLSEAGKAASTTVP